MFPGTKWGFCPQWAWRLSDHGDRLCPSLLLRKLHPPGHRRSPAVRVTFLLQAPGRWLCHPEVAFLPPTPPHDTSCSSSCHLLEGSWEMQFLGWLVAASAAKEACVNSGCTVTVSTRPPGELLPPRPLLLWVAHLCSWLPGHSPSPSCLCSPLPSRFPHPPCSLGTGPGR